jgi:hypothetical protein
MRIRFWLKTGCGNLIMDSATNLLSFSTPTHTHDFGNHSIGYSRSRQHSCGVLVDHRKLVSLIGLIFEMVSELGEIYDF